MVIEEKAFPRIERGDGGHIPVGKYEIEDVDILLHPFDMRRFGDDDYAALNEPTQGNLRHRFAVFVSDFSKLRIREKAVTAFGERCPRP